MAELPTAPTTTTDAEVRLTVPADGAFVYVLRTTAASLAARVDFTVDDVEDLRIAIGEAASLLVAAADPQTHLDCVFELTSGAVEATLSVPSGRGLTTSSDSFAWQVLSTLTASCASTHDQGRSTIALTVRSILDSAEGDLDVDGRV